MFTRYTNKKLKKERKKRGGKRWGGGKEKITPCLATFWPFLNINRSKGFYNTFDLLMMQQSACFTCYKSRDVGGVGFLDFLGFQMVEGEEREQQPRQRKRELQPRQRERRGEEHSTTMSGHRG